MKIVETVRDYQNFEGKVIIYGGGRYGMQLYESIYGYLESKNIYVCDRDNRVCEKFPQYIYLKDLKDFIKQYQNVDIIIAVIDKNVVCNVYHNLINMGVKDKEIYQYIPETKEAWIHRKMEEGFFNGNRIVHIMQDNKARELIEKLIKGKEPFLLARWGAVEGKIVNRYRIGILTEDDREEGRNNAGIFPTTDEVITEYVKVTEKAAKEIDILAMGFWVPQLEELYRIYSPKAIPVTSMMLSIPEDPELVWTRSLKNMKVLVIHPFASLIQQQYKKRNQLFRKLGRDFLPEMELITYQAVQSMGGTTEYASWNAALEKMERDISKIDFDIALIGCGGYGLPLGAYIKAELHKKAIHVGGGIAIVFWH